VDDRQSHDAALDVVAVLRVVEEGGPVFARRLGDIDPAQGRTSAPSAGRAIDPKGISNRADGALTASGKAALIMMLRSRQSRRITQSSRGIPA